jgi:hypothetical protein
MSATIDRVNRVQQLDGKSEPRAIVTDADVQRPAILARLLRALLDSVAALERKSALRRVTYPPRVLLADGTTKYRFPHGLGVIPDILIVRWDGAAAPNLKVHADSNGATLVVTSLSAGTATLRLEAP